MNNESNSVSPSEMNANDLPDVPAFKDEFTRDFLQSAEQVKDGFYPFVSGSGSFTMNFPQDMKVNKRSYEIGTENESEFISISHSDEQKDGFINQKISYISFMSDPENGKERMRSSSKRELDFKVIETEHKGQKLEISEYESDPFSVVAAFIWNDNNQGITIFSHIDCKEDLTKQQCATAKSSEKETIMEMLKSIEFTAKESE
ncbi:hypothetical protein [Terribacillus sp. DMT04]|uniref:hypothetical protein n=1 Tax=Terribacillus sp. DMT04 TaxID=2850441 RepID=UPI001C2C18E7|nr:hypothetical protein [Terribacillus sp. DMT04]QXE02416.1 hypothetical protein KS242_04100 [Terribacillus sp. DMT04]